MKVGLLFIAVLLFVAGGVSVGMHTNSFLLGYGFFGIGIVGFVFGNMSVKK